MFDFNRITLLLLLFTGGCAKEIIFDDLVEENPKLVVISHITTGSPMRFCISSSTSLWGNDSLPPGSILDFSLTQNGKKLDDFIQQLNGSEIFITSKTHPDYDSLFEMNLQVDGYPMVHASTKIPHPVLLENPLNDRSKISIIDAGGNQKIMRVPITFKPELMEGSDSLFLLNLGEYEYYRQGPGDYIGERYTFVADGNTFAYLYQYSDHTVLIHKKYWEDNPGGTLTIEALLPYIDGEQEIQEIRLDWLTLSKEYYNYRLSLAKQGNIGQPFSSPDVVYSNIIGGYGNFAGYSLTKYSIPL